MSKTSRKEEKVLLLPFQGIMSRELSTKQPRLAVAKAHAETQQAVAPIAASVHTASDTKAADSGGGGGGGGGSAAAAAALHERDTSACAARGGKPTKLSGEEIAAYLKEVDPTWQLVQLSPSGPQALRRELTARNFKQVRWGTRIAPSIVRACV